jgi:hypothetical protein
MRDEKGAIALSHAAPSPPTDAKRVLPPIPIPCGGGLGDGRVPQWGSGGNPQRQIWLNKQIKFAVGNGFA